MIPDVPPEPLRSGLALALASVRSALADLDSALSDWGACCASLPDSGVALAEIASVWKTGLDHSSHYLRTSRRKQTCSHGG